MNTCNCYEQIREKLKAQGLAISDKCKAMRITDLKLSARLCFPLQSADGKKLKRGEPKFMFLSFCPFCGEKYEREEEPAA